MLCRHADVGARTGGTGHGEMRDQFWRILLLWQAHANQHTVRAAVNTKVEHLTCLMFLLPFGKLRHAKAI